MEISQVDYVSRELEAGDEAMEGEEEYELEGEGHVGPPTTITEDDHIEQVMDVPQVLLLRHHIHSQQDNLEVVLYMYPKR
jgi:hypothetical protein